jgi:hypothetical protein
VSGAVCLQHPIHPILDHQPPVKKLLTDAVSTERLHVSSLAETAICITEK